jgi:UDP-N-acetylmuramate--alanine ligase
VFQPHQHQRTLCLLPEFADSLAGADAAIVADIYGARESAEIRASVSAADLVAAVVAQGGVCSTGGEVAGLPERVLERVRASDIVLLLGAGDIDRALGGIVAGL